jgi:protein-S-isoprenylcysteine O-methyltransferase Ste14
MRDGERPAAARVAIALARRRVALGFVTGAVALVVASPTWATWRAGLVVAVLGEALRIWAAGHLEKSREVTSSGPYQWIRHPLYAGSAFIAAGVGMASNSVVVAVVVTVYMAATLAAAVKTEEAFLRATFGDSYGRYERSEAQPMARRFSLARAVRNREHRAVAGLAAGFGLLALKVVLSL